MTVSKWAPAEYLEYRDKCGILSATFDLYAFRLLVDSLPVLENILELGGYIGGMPIYLNEILKKNNRSIKFTSVDHMAWIESTKFPWATHLRRHLTETEIVGAQHIKTEADAINWIKTRCLSLTGKEIDIDWQFQESNVPDIQYDIIFQDYGQTLEENVDIIDRNLSRLSKDGIYVVDDFEPAQPYRVMAAVQAVQQEKLFPIFWAAKKVFLANNIEFAQNMIERISSNVNYDENAISQYVEFKSKNIVYSPLRATVSFLK